LFLNRKNKHEEAPMKKIFLVALIAMAVFAGCASSDDDPILSQGDQGIENNSNNNTNDNPKPEPKPPVVKQMKVSVWRASHSLVDSIPLLLMKGTAEPILMMDETDITTESSSKAKPAKTVITIDPAKKYQSILGMGGSFDHSTCWNLKKLGIGSDEWKQAILFMFGGQYEKAGEDPVQGMGQSLARICIGTSDFIPDDQDWYSYDDMPAGQTDYALEHFSIDKDRDYVLPVIKYAQQANPDLKFFASPWSPPAWMKKSGRFVGSKNADDSMLVPTDEIYDAYARYLVKFIRAYEAEGVPIEAITVQNEPDMVHEGYPTCRWTAETEEYFIRYHLGPLFEEEGITAKIWCLDHNWNLLDFPRKILGEQKTAKYVDGTAFHSYEGNIKSQAAIHDEFPDKNIYFTERSYYRTQGAVSIINIFRNWARSYNFWVVMLDKNSKPNKGPHSATPTCMEIVQSGNDYKVSYKFDFNMYSLFMKFIAPGAVRIDSSDALDNAAFLNPDGTIVMVAANSGMFPKDFSVVIGETTFSDKIGAFTVAAYQIRAEE
jgi:O-glycosyl hydrolase